MRRLIIVVLLVLLTGVAVSQARETGTVIGLSVPSQDDGFFSLLITGVQEAADAANVQLSVADSEYDPVVEAEQVQGLIDAGVSALLIYPLPDGDLIPALEAANEAEIPVFLLGRDIDRGESSAEVVSVLLPTDEDTGATAGRFLCENGDPEKLVVILAGVTAPAEETDAADTEPLPVAEQPAVIALTAEIEGLTAYMAENCGDLNVTVQPSETFTNAESVTYFEGLIEDGQSVGSVFAPNAELTTGLLDVARSNRLRGIGFVTTELTADMLGALEARRIAGIVSPDPLAMGGQALATVLAFLGGEPVEASVSVALTVVDPETAEAYRYTPCPRPGGCPAP